MKSFIRSTALAMAGLLAAGAAQASALDGNWISPCAKGGDDGYYVMKVSFAAGQFTGHYDAYEDTQCAGPIVNAGDYALTYVEGRPYGEGTEIDVVQDNDAGFGIYRIEANRLYVSEIVEARADRPKKVDRSFFFVRQ